MTVIIPRSNILSSGLTENDVTEESLFNSRRTFIKSSMALSAMAYFPQLALASGEGGLKNFANRFTHAKKTVDLDAELHSYEDITTYNNFYELGYSKGDPVRNASKLITDPWSVKIDGECNKPGNYTLEDILKPHHFEERIYRFRCVEAWSMVIPWVGFSLGDLIKRFEPTSKAKYVAFETIYDKENPLPGQKRNVLAWPYREGLRMDEAMNPLAMLAVGLYGKPLPNQNGAPLRLVVPWKYGFKSIKSIVRIRFTEEQPDTSWNLSAPREYGFYSNVNPNVNHPRWSQRRERVIGKLFKQKTLMFNGYQEQVQDLYAGMSLKKNF
ncbi:MAG: protein-methionine-sulfoxide reductase catalytic subunit MsrP [Cellvibrionaceae bacterium]